MPEGQLGNLDVGLHLLELQSRKIRKNILMHRMNIWSDSIELIKEKVKKLKRSMEVWLEDEFPEFEWDSEAGPLWLYEGDWRLPIYLTGMIHDDCHCNVPFENVQVQKPTIRAMWADPYENISESGDSESQVDSGPDSGTNSSIDSYDSGPDSGTNSSCDSMLIDWAPNLEGDSVAMSTENDNVREVLECLRGDPGVQDDQVSSPSDDVIME